MGVSGLGHETTKGELLWMDLKMLLRDPSARWCQTWQRRKGATVYRTSSSAGGLILTITQPCERGISIPINRGEIGGSEGLSHFPKATELSRNRTGVRAPWSSFCKISGTYKHLVGHRGKKISYPGLSCAPPMTWWEKKELWVSSDQVPAQPCART